MWKLRRGDSRAEAYFRGVDRRTLQPFVFRRLGASGNQAGRRFWLPTSWKITAGNSGIGCMSADIFPPGRRMTMKNKEPQLEKKYWLGTYCRWYPVMVICLVVVDFLALVVRKS